MYPAFPTTGSNEGLWVQQLVTATVAQVAADWCTTEAVNIKRAAVSHFNVGEPATTV